MLKTKNMKKYILGFVFFGLMASVAPIVVALEEHRALKTISQKDKLKDPDFATCYFYDELCKERNLTNENTCKQATQTLKSYWEGKRNIKFYGY